VCEADNLTTFMCRMSLKSGSLNLLEHSGPNRVCYKTLYLYACPSSTNSIHRYISGTMSTIFAPIICDYPLLPIQFPELFVLLPWRGSEFVPAKHCLTSTWPQTSPQYDGILHTHHSESLKSQAPFVQMLLYPCHSLLVLNYVCTRVLWYSGYDYV